MSSPADLRPPASGPAREALRAKGQFWTPDWIADAMAAYVLRGQPKEVYDPAVGRGSLLLAANRLSAAVKLRGAEIDRDLSAIGDFKGAGIEIEQRDFVLSPPAEQFAAILANPPYIRHHRLAEATKRRLRLFCRSLTGF